MALCAFLAAEEHVSFLSLSSWQLSSNRRKLTRSIDALLEKVRLAVTESDASFAEKLLVLTEKIVQEAWCVSEVQ